MVEYKLSTLMFKLQLLHLYAFLNGLGFYLMFSGLASWTLWKAGLGAFFFFGGFYRAYETARLIDEAYGGEM